MAGSKNLMCLKYSYNKFSMNILKYLLIACSCLIGAAHAQSPIAKDTIEYRAHVWVDKTDLERYGGEEDFKKNLKKMFHNTTRFLE